MAIVITISGGVVTMVNNGITTRTGSNNAIRYSTYGTGTGEYLMLSGWGFSANDLVSNFNISGVTPADGPAAITALKTLFPNANSGSGGSGTGIPTGGSTGTVLTKNSATDGDASFLPPTQTFTSTPSGTTGGN